MNDILSEEKMIKIDSFNGINIYNVRMEKFKTNTINIFFHDNLTKKNAAKNALLPAVLRRGTSNYPSFKELALYLESLYGASFDCGVVKKGERQIVQFYIEFVNDKYTGEDSKLFEKAFELLFEILTKPVLENGIFKNDYVAQEKENLKKLIESRVNDKMQYAVDRCFEEMCQDEPFGIFEYGTIEDVNSISSQELYDYFGSFLETLPVNVFITGNVDEAGLKLIKERLLTLNRKDIKSVEINNVEKHVKDVKNIVEKMNVNQGKLSMGFRTNTASDHPDYYSLLVCNGILGGGMHSKLFQNVREKESLAYYAFSRLEKFKGLMMISSGIDIKNKDKAMEIILKQLEEIKAGNISDYEYDSTIKSIETGIKSLKDSQINVVDFYLGQSISNTDDTLDSIIERVKKVTKQNVVDISQKITLDTVYFLTGE